MMMTSVSVVGATFHPGDRGDQIVAIQNALVRNGSDIAVDGDYGTGTKEAVKAFQERHGLDVDGIVGAQTYEALMGAADRRAKLRELRGGADAEEMTDRARTAAFAEAVRKEDRL